MEVVLARIGRVSTDHLGEAGDTDIRLHLEVRRGGTWRYKGVPYLYYLPGPVVRGVLLWRGAALRGRPGRADPPAAGPAA